MKSVQQMLATVCGMIDTKDLTTWENAFLKSVNSLPSHALSSKQVECIERIYNKHFAG